MTDNQLTRYQEAVAKGRRWLLSRLQPGGLFDVQSLNLRCYLRSPLALLMAGAPGAAYPLLDTIRNRYLCPDGDFRTSPEVKYASDRFNLNGERNFYLYGNGWATLSAHLNGRFDISFRGADYMLRYQDPWTGWFLSCRDSSTHPDARQDVASTASCCYALLFCGRISQAARAADFLLRLIELQPEEGCFYLSVTRRDGVINQFSQEDRFFYVVDGRQPKQAYWMLGYASAILAKVYLASRENRYLEGAVRYFDFLTACQPDVTSFFGFWKMAWAAALLGSILQEDKYTHCATDLLDRIASAQKEEGYWAWSRELGIGPEQDDWLVDLSSEMMLWLCELLRILLSRQSEKVGPAQDSLAGTVSGPYAQTLPGK